MAEGDDILRITVNFPRLDAATAPACRGEIEENLQEAPRRVLVDLSLVSFVDSTGLGVLVALVKKMSADGKIAVVGANAAVRRLFQITKLDTLFLLCDSEDAAHAALA